MMIQSVGLSFGKQTAPATQPTAALQPADRYKGSLVGKTVRRAPKWQAIFNRTLPQHQGVDTFEVTRDFMDDPNAFNLSKADKRTLEVKTPSGDSFSKPAFFFEVAKS